MRRELLAFTAAIVAFVSLGCSKVAREDLPSGIPGDSHYKPAGDPFILLNVDDSEGELEVEVASSNGAFPANWSFTAIALGKSLPLTWDEADRAPRASFGPSPTQPVSIRIELRRPDREVTLYEVDLPSLPAPVVTASTVKLGGSFGVSVEPLPPVPGEDCETLGATFEGCAIAWVGSEGCVGTSIDHPSMLPPAEFTKPQSMQVDVANDTYERLPCDGNVVFQLYFTRGYSDASLMVGRRQSHALTFTR